MKIMKLLPVLFLAAIMSMQSCKSLKTIAIRALQQLISGIFSFQTVAQQALPAIKKCKPLSGYQRREHLRSRGQPPVNRLAADAQLACGLRHVAVGALQRLFTRAA